MAKNSPAAFGDLTGKRAVVTGASSGIGRAIALEFACAGADVVVHYAKSRDAAEEVVGEIQGLGRRAIALSFPLPSTECDAFVAETWSIWNSIDIWVNNAGVDLLTGAGAKLSFADKLAALWQIDVAGTMLLSRAILNKMKAAGSGVILNIGWDQADRGMEGDSAELFSASKNAIMGFTRSLSLTAAPEVRVNCIAPGWIQTAWGENVRSEWHERVRRETPLQRWGQPEDIARLARFLVSDAASYLTGQVINANGGAIR